METSTRLLNDAAQQIVAEERQLLLQLQALLIEYGADDARRDNLASSLAQLEELFLLVVVGEFNAGKSALINVLLRNDVLQEGVTPTTSAITIVRYGDTVGGPAVTPQGIAEVTAPMDLLRDLHIVDTPGTNAIVREHETLTQKFLPRADLVLFITSADRPFTESERLFLERIRDWGKKTVLVVNKADILDKEDERSAVVDFVRTNARALLGTEPVVFAVSARLAKQGLRGDARLFEISGIDAFESYLRQTLDQRERLRLKLSSPLGVAERLAETLLADVEPRRALLTDDVETLGRIDRQLSVYEEDLRRDVEFRMADVEKLLVEMERRGHDHFDETIRIGRVFDLLNKARMQASFEEHVVGDTPRRIDRKVTEVIDWLVDADFRQWQAVNELLTERRVQRRERSPEVPPVGRFEHDRSRMFDSLGRDVERIVQGYDRRREADVIADKARSAVATSAAIEIGAVGLGAVVATVASTAAADVTGLAMAGVVATLGLLVIPNRRRMAKQELREKLSALRSRLSTSLRSAFEDELRRSLTRIKQHVEPYSQFVRAEQQHLDEARERLRGLRAQVDVLRDRIAKVS